MIHQNTIQVVGTGSDGNCCVVYDSSGDAIIIDIGLSMEATLKAMNYHIEHVQGALVSHRHIDHSRYIPDFLRSSIKVYSNMDVVELYPNCSILRAKFSLGNSFMIRTFTVEHNAPCNAFIVDTKDNIRILYITDASRVTKMVKNVDYLVIECNHDMETIVDSAISSGSVTLSQYYNHMSLDRCVDYIAHMDKCKLKGILLWHSSSSNLNKAKAIDEIKKIAGIENVVLAKKDMLMRMFDDNF